MSSRAELPIPRGRYNDIKDAYLEHAFQKEQVFLTLSLIHIWYAYAAVKKMNSTHCMLSKNRSIKIPRFFS